MAANLAGMAFVPYYNQLMKILDTDERLKKSAKGIFGQMAYAAGGAAVGGVCAGPPGAMVGGIVGSVVGYLKTDDYDAMLTVLKEMNDEQKSALVKRVQELIGSSTIESLIGFVGQQVNRELLLNLIGDFAKHASKGG